MDRPVNSHHDQHLRSFDENEVRLAERLNNLYDSAKSDNKVLDMAVVPKEVHDFGRTVRDNRQMTFNSQEKMKVTTGVKLDRYIVQDTQDPAILGLREGPYFFIISLFFMCQYYIKFIFY